MGNGGAYIVWRVEVEALGQDKQKWDKNPACENLHLWDRTHLYETQYGVFHVPAPCSYRLTIHIEAGATTSNHVFVSPGCAITYKSGGTSYDHDTPRVKAVKWADGAKEKIIDKGYDPATLPVSDMSFHKTLGESVIHYCNKDDDADKKFN